MQKSDQVLSKEKQKFFRLCALSSGKRRSKSKSSDRARSDLEDRLCSHSSGVRMTDLNVLESKKSLSKFNSIGTNVDHLKNLSPVDRNLTKTTSSSDKRSKTECRILSQDLHLSDTSDSSEDETITSHSKIIQSNIRHIVCKNKVIVKQETFTNKVNIDSYQKSNKPRRTESKSIKTTLEKHKKSSKLNMKNMESSSDSSSFASDSSSSSDCSSSSSESRSNSTSSSDDSDSDSLSHKTEPIHSKVNDMSQIKSNVNVQIKNSNVFSTLDSNVGKNKILYNNCGLFGAFSNQVNEKKESLWGFAAEAKRQTNLFISNSYERTFGTFPESVMTNKNQSIFDKQPSPSNSNTNLEKCKPGAGQLRGLFDGLSHLFTTPKHSRSRTGQSPDYSEKKRRKTIDSCPKAFSVTEPREILKETRSTYKNYAFTKLKEKQTPDELRNVPEVKTTHASGFESSTNSFSSVLRNYGHSSKTLQSSTCSMEISTTSKNISSAITKFSDTILEKPSNEIYMSPSYLVKTAVNSKQHENDYRSFIKSETNFPSTSKSLNNTCFQNTSFGSPGIGFNIFNTDIGEDPNLKKMFQTNAEANQKKISSCPFTFSQPFSNQTGKITLRTQPQNIPLYYDP